MSFRRRNRNPSKRHSAQRARRYQAADMRTAPTTAYVDFGQTESSVVSGKADITNGREDRAGTEGGAVHRRDGRNLTMVNGGISLSPSEVFLGSRGEDLTQIEPCTKCPCATSCEDYAVHV